ncbi:MAG TPA: LysR substrate-binding domain-containing protein [Candidatus Binatia bacterium]
MELRRLKYFIAVAEELHFGRAAAKLRITQPPLSQQIQLLERELGMQLFHRTKRHVELTSMGRVFLGEARAVLDQAEGAVARTRRVQRGESGQMSIGWMPWAELTPLPYMIRAFCERYPDVRLDVRSLSVSDQLAALQEGKIDVGFVLSTSVLEATDPPKDGLKTEIVLKPPLVVVAPRSHRFAARQRIELAELANEPYILFKRESGPVFYDYVISFYHKNGLRLDIRHEADHPSAVLGLVAAGLGITILPFTANGFVAGVVLCELPAATPELEIALAWRAQNDSALLANFIETIRAYEPDAAGGKRKD